MEIYKVVLNKKVKKSLVKVPLHIVRKLNSWIESVSHDGLSEVSKLTGFHDEPLLGKRSGQRSIRLSKAYRAIYEIDESDVVHFVEVLEVNKHEY